MEKLKHKWTLHHITISGGKAFHKKDMLMMVYYNKVEIYKLWDISDPYPARADILWSSLYHLWSFERPEIYK
jgi:hypothetical protein